MKKARCIDNKGCEVSLEKGKVYKVLSARPKGWLTVTDESGETYLHLRRRFEEVREKAK